MDYSFIQKQDSPVLKIPRKRWTDNSTKMSEGGQGRAGQDRTGKEVEKVVPPAGNWKWKHERKVLKKEGPSSLSKVQGPNQVCSCPKVVLAAGPTLTTWYLLVLEYPNQARHHP